MEIIQLKFEFNKITNEFELSWTWRVGEYEIGSNRWVADATSVIQVKDMIILWEAFINGSKLAVSTKSSIPTIVKE